MSQSVKEFVRQSGVDVRQSPNYNSNSNNNFARELEEQMWRDERARQERMARREDIARGQQFFREPVRPELQQRQVPPMAMRPPPPLLLHGADSRDSKTTPLLKMNSRTLTSIN